MRRRAVTGRPRVVALLAVAAALGCVGPGTVPGDSSVAFDSVRVWIHSDSDSTELLVEVARTEAQQTVGLSGREELDPGSGMLFVFDEPRPDTAGFWMWQTRMPLDIAFLDREGVILDISGMDPCLAPDPDPCPPYRAGVEHWFALEVNRGWFRRHGIEPGSRVGVEELRSP